MALAAAPARPNFVFILADDLGWSDLGCYGSRFYETPQLDRFAATAMRFTQAYSACPVCSPTRTALMTGKYPARVGLTDYLPGLQPKDRPLLSVEDLDELPEAEVTLAEAFSQAGYRTFTRGKWHLGERGPEHHGFTTPLRQPASKAKGRDAAMTEDCLHFLEECGGDPFFLYVPFTYPHTPVNAVEPHAERFRAKLANMNYPEPRLGRERRGITRLYQDDPAYASMLWAMDEFAGRLIAKLDELKLAENTVVVFTSDNGGLCTHGNAKGGPTANPPLRSGKGWCYEGGIRVPLLIRAPGVTRGGQHVRGTSDHFRLLSDAARACRTARAAGAAPGRREPGETAARRQPSRAHRALLALPALPRQYLGARRGDALGRLEADRVL